MIDQKTIHKIAKLARLKITDNEAEQYSNQLTKVLSHFDEISKINTEGVEPLITPTEIELFLREDVAEQKFTAEEMVKNAPEKAGNLFKVPPVV